MIEFKCSECGENLRVRDEAAGKRGKCRQCGTILRVPHAAAPTPTPSPPPTGSAHATGMDVPQQPSALAAELDKSLPIRWLNFYVYFRIPASIVLSVIYGLLIFALYSVDTTVALFALFALIFIAAYICLAVFLFVGLHRRRRWGWKLNWFLLGLDFLLGALGYPGRVIIHFFSVGVLAFGWLLPNVIYFKKRRHLFTT